MIYQSIDLLSWSFCVLVCVLYGLIVLIDILVKKKEEKLMNGRI